MLKLYYEGWYQCRLATDPDPSDDPRGVSGPTFATIDEPDLDRVIRLQDPVTPRWPHDNDIGVNVTRVTLKDIEQPSHPLLGAEIRLLDEAKYEGRNFIIAGTGREPIDPFHLEIRTDDIVIRRKDVWDPMNPDLGILEISAAMMDRRQPTFVVMSPVVADTTGIVDYTGFRQQRLKDLQERIKGVTNPLQQGALNQRINNIEKDGNANEGITSALMIFLGVQEIWDFGINGPQPEIIDEKNLLRGTISTQQVWPINFWMGGYDVDTMVAYMKGSLSLPFVPAL